MCQWIVLMMIWLIYYFPLHTLPTLKTTDTPCPTSDTYLMLHPTTNKWAGCDSFILFQSNSILIVSDLTEQSPKKACKYKWKLYSQWCLGLFQQKDKEGM